MSGGYNWIRSKDCNGLVEMEKGKLKRELVSEFLEDLKFELFDLSHGETSFPEFWIKVYDVSKIKEKWEGKLK